jgi:hypothetical protein
MQIRRRAEIAKLTVTVVEYEGAQSFLESGYAKSGYVYSSATH